MESVVLVAAALHDRCTANRALEPAHRSCYHSSRIPGITMFDYLKRISKYSRCSSECVIIALIYLDRYVAATQIPITFRNIHRLTITAILVAAKIRDDIYFSNAYYASIGGVSPPEINALELDFVKTLRWITWVEPSEYNAYHTELGVRHGDQVQLFQAAAAAHAMNEGVAARAAAGAGVAPPA